MSEPAASTANAAAGAAGITLTLSGSVFGLHFDAMFAGFAAALIAQTFVPSGVTRMRGFLQLLASGGLAGFFAPIGVAVAGKVAPWPLPHDALQLAVGATLGIVAPIAVPLIRRWVDRFGDRGDGRKP